MMATTFSALPSKWIRDKKLVNFLGTKQPGKCIAALKCLIALNVNMDYETKITSNVSISKMEDLTNLSRPMVICGIRLLEYIGIIETSHKNGKKTEYFFLHGDDGWAKLPKTYALNLIKNLSNRRLSSLVALKIYLTLIAFRKNYFEYVQLKHDTILLYTGIRPNQVKLGTQILIDLKLIEVYQEMNKDVRRYNANKYAINGIEVEAG